MAGEIDGEAKYFVGVWDGDGEVGMEEVTAVTSYFILQMDVGGHLFRCRIASLCISLLVLDVLTYV